MRDSVPGLNCVVGIVLFHGVEELEFAAPYAVFAAMRRLQIETNDPALPETHVLAITRTPGIVHGANGLRFLPDYDLTMCPDLDVLIVPGSGEIGEPTVPEMEEGGLWEFVHERSRQVRCLAAIGTGSFVLAKAGVLSGKAATTHRKYLDRLTRFEGVTPRETAVVEDGMICTARSGSWGVKLGLTVIGNLWGRPAADLVAQELGEEMPGTRPAP
jgi:transcriptional regulator GlxA family with amidase domain